MTELRLDTCKVSQVFLNRDKNSRKGLAKYGQRVLDKIRIRTIFKHRFPYFYGEMKYLLFYYVHIFPLSTITDQSYQH